VELVNINDKLENLLCKGPLLTNFEIASEVQVAGFLIFGLM